MKRYFKPTAQKRIPRVQTALTIPLAFLLRQEPYKHINTFRYSVKFIKPSPNIIKVHFLPIGFF